MMTLKRLQTKRGILLLCVLLIAVLAAFYFVLYWGAFRIKDLDADRAAQDLQDAAQAEDQIQMNVDTLSYDKDYLTLAGYVILKGTATSPSAFQVVLRDTESDSYYLLPTSQVERPDITAYINDGVDYTNSGFQVRLPFSKKLNPREHTYKAYVLWKLQDQELLIPLNTTVQE